MPTWLWAGRCWCCLVRQGDRRVSRCLWCKRGDPTWDVSDEIQTILSLTAEDRVTYLSIRRDRCFCGMRDATAWHQWVRSVTPALLACQSHASPTLGVGGTGVGRVRDRGS
jgi:hypothetical protein